MCYLFIAAATQLDEFLKFVFQPQIGYWCSFRFSVDDGTGVAFVNCHGDQVANLLTLDPGQWDHLKSKAGETGGVSYEMVGTDNSEWQSVVWIEWVGWTWQGRPVCASRSK